jgi:hypothetical protein
MNMDHWIKKHSLDKKNNSLLYHVQVFHLPNDIATPTAICGAVGCQTHHR